MFGFLGAGKGGSRSRGRKRSPRGRRAVAARAPVPAPQRASKASQAQARQQQQLAKKLKRTAKAPQQSNPFRAPKAVVQRPVAASAPMPTVKVVAPRSHGTPRTTNQAQAAFARAKLAKSRVERNRQRQLKLERAAAAASRNRTIQMAQARKAVIVKAQKPAGLLAFSRSQQAAPKPVPAVLVAAEPKKLAQQLTARPTPRGGMQIPREVRIARPKAAPPPILAVQSLTPATPTAAAPTAMAPTIKGHKTLPGQGGAVLDWGDEAPARDTATVTKTSMSQDTPSLPGAPANTEAAVAVAQAEVEAADAATGVKPPPAAPVRISPPAYRGLSFNQKAAFAAVLLAGVAYVAQTK